MKRNGSSYSWLSITQIQRKTKWWHKFVQGNESSSYRMWKFCSEGSFALNVVCEIVQFFEYLNYWELTVFMNFQIFPVSKNLQKYLKSWLLLLFFSSIVVKIEVSRKKYSLFQSSRKQNWRIKVHSISIR